MNDDLPKVKSIKAILEGDDNFYAMMRAKPLLDRLEWAAFKMCQRGHHEDFASDVMTEAKARIEMLEGWLFEIKRVKSEEIPDSEIYGLPIMCDGTRIFPLLGEEYVLFAARAALAGKKKNDELS